MAAWQPTHGKARGCYLRAGDAELYVRQELGAEDIPTGRWQLFVDGQLEGEADGETTAKAAAELAIRCMIPADGAGGEATAA